MVELVKLKITIKQFYKCFLKNLLICVMANDNGPHLDDVPQLIDGLSLPAPHCPRQHLTKEEINGDLKDADNHYKGTKYQ